MPLVSGTSLQTKSAAKAQTAPWNRNREWRPRVAITEGVTFTPTNTVTFLGLDGWWRKPHLTTWAMQEPRVRNSGVKISPMMVYGTAPTPMP